jgi:DnaJ-like protein
MTRAEALRILELDERCTPEQVRATYRELVKAWHPDRFANDADLRAKADRRLQEINRAYAALQERAKIVDRPPEEGLRPHVATQRSETQSTSARRSLALLVITGLVAGASVVGIVLIVVGSSQKAPVPGPISGTDLLAAPLDGSGSLIVQNADRRDAVLVFVDAGVQKRALFIRAGEKLQMLDVEPGAYRIWVAAGLGWTRDHFATDQRFQEIEEPLTFANDDSQPQVITIAAAGTGNRPRLHARAPFLLNIRR